MIIDYLKANAKNCRDYDALKEVEFFKERYIEKEISWGIFNTLSNKVANYLIKIGVKKGDKVGILLRNCIEWLPIFLVLSKQVRL